MSTTCTSPSTHHCHPTRACCPAPLVQPSGERAGKAKGVHKRPSEQGEALAMSLFVACLQSTLGGATASKDTRHSGLTPDRGLSTAPSHSKPSTTQLLFFLFLFFVFQAQMGPEWENELLFNYHPAFNILWPIVSHVYLHPLSLPDFFF